MLIRTLKNNIIEGTKRDIEQEIISHIVEKYNHKQCTKTQFIECDLPGVIFDNKYLKGYLDEILSDSGITYRERGILLLNNGDYMRISMRIPAHFYSDKPVPKKKQSKKALSVVNKLATAIVDNAEEPTTTKE